MSQDKSNDNRNKVNTINKDDVIANHISDDTNQNITIEVLTIYSYHLPSPCWKKSILCWSLSIR